MLAVLLPRGAKRQIASGGPAQVDAPTIRQGHGAQGREDDLVPSLQPERRVDLSGSKWITNPWGVVNGVDYLSSGSLDDVDGVDQW